MHQMAFIITRLVPVRRASYGRFGFAQISFFGTLWLLLRMFPALFDHYSFDDVDIKCTHRMYQTSVLSF